MEALEDALNEIRKSCPGWAFAVLAKAVRDRNAAIASEYEADTADALWEWAQDRLPVQVWPRGASACREATTQATLKAAARWAFDLDGGSEPVVKGADGVACTLNKAAYPDLASVVPSQGPSKPKVAFVGLSPTALDAAKGEPFSGEDGAYFVEHYLAPLGLRKADVLLTNVVPVAGEHPAEEMVQYTTFAKRELETYAPEIVVALGQSAKRGLGELAHFTLPHPSAVRRLGDNGEVVRKLKAIKTRLEEVQAAEASARKGIVVAIDGSKADDMKKVHISKALDEARVVIGVVLDCYQFDSQGDYVPPAEVEKTCHDWMEQFRVIGLQHTGAADAVVVENWLWPYPSEEDYQNAKKGLPHNAYAAKYGDQVVHSGSWMLGVKIKDDATWQAILDGALTAYSIGGSGLQTPIAPTAMPKVTFINA